MGTRVAMVELTASPPRILLAGHLDGEAPVLVYRVADLRGAMKELEARGWKRAGTFEIPFGPVCSFVAPGGQHVAIYERSRPEVEGALRRSNSTSESVGSKWCRGRPIAPSKAIPAASHGASLVSFRAAPRWRPDRLPTVIRSGVAQW